MSEPVVVIHGVANRDKQPFLDGVKRLQARIADLGTLVPVFWGDLGGQSTDIADSLPKFDGGEWTVRSLELGPSADPELLRTELGGEKSNEERAASICAAAVPGSEIVRGNGSARLQRLIEEELAQTHYLRFVDDEGTLSAVGEIVYAVLEAHTGTTDPEFAIRGWSFSEITDAVAGAIGKVIEGVDRSIGRVIEDRLGAGNQRIRAKAMPWFSLFFGDIFAYQRNSTVIQGRIWTALEDAAEKGRIKRGYGKREKPVHVVAHSLGGIVTFDAAVQPPDDQKLWMKTWTTFGSQAAFFHILDRRKTLTPYRNGQPVTLPSSIAKWVNLWHPMDLLGFTAGTVFRLHDGSMPADVPVTEPATHLVGDKLWAHSIYWETDELVNSLRKTLSA